MVSKNKLSLFILNEIEKVVCQSPHIAFNYDIYSDLVKRKICSFLPQWSGLWINSYYLLVLFSLFFFVYYLRLFTISLYFDSILTFTLIFPFHRCPSILSIEYVASVKSCGVFLPWFHSIWRLLHFPRFYLQLTTTIEKLINFLDCDFISISKPMWLSGYIQSHLLSWVLYVPSCVRNEQSSQGYCG